MSKEKLYDHWSKEAPQHEDDMERGHQRYWERNIYYFKEKELKDCAVLDFGCNQGGFLRYLYDVRPFKKGVGVDLATKAIQIANERKKDLPITYVNTADITTLDEKFDLAVSTSVIYLIEDLKDHAQKIKKVLKPGGVYYASFTDYNGNPNLPDMYLKINGYANVKMQLHSLDHIAKAFQQEGFQVEIRRLQPVDFVVIKEEDDWYQRISERMQFEYEQGYLFRMTKK